MKHEKRPRKDAVEKDDMDQIALENTVWTEFGDLPPEVQERRYAIRDLKRKNLSNAAIARLLNVSERTIYNDLNWLKQVAEKYPERFISTQEIGDTIEFLKECEDKSMAAWERAMEDNEKLVWVNDDDGKLVQEMKNVPDHSAANRHMMAALTSRKMKVDLLQKVGLMKIVPERKELIVGGRVDVSKLRGADLDAAERELEAQCAKIQAQLDRLDTPNPFEELDS